jgi:PAS domain S-box-containing protein
VYEDELQTYRTFLNDGRIRMTRFMAAAGIVITIGVGMLGIFITWTITRPVRQMTVVAEKIIHGDFNQTAEVAARDDIGVLARTFNLMTGRLKQSMESIRESEEKYRGIYENALEGMFQTTIEGRFIRSNPAMARILGYESPEDLITSMTDIIRQLYVNPADRLALIAEISEHGEVFGREIQFSCKDKRKIWVSVSARMVRDISGRPSFIEGFLTDISRRKQAEEALAESRNYLDEIINSVADPMFVKDRQHRWVLVNNALCAFMGHPREEILGKSDYDYFPKSEADVFWSKDEAVLTSGMENINEEALTDAQGTVHTIVTKKTFYTDKKGEKYIVAIIRDITDQKRSEEEKKRLEARLAQAQKMEAIGTLAGGIAHDFNNILSAIIGYTELAMDDIPQPGKAQADLKEVLKAGERAKELVKQILAFSRMTETEYSPLALRTVVKESLMMLRSVIPSTIEIRQNLTVSGLVMSDPTQINQIMINLCTNAVHAMDETGGVLEVSLQEVSLDRTAGSPDLDLASGPYMKLTVRDTGKGMPPEVKGRMFEPYFTTKELGRGTGLGLSVVHGIVKSHGGAITCTSIPREGTTFEVYLPKIRSEETRLEYEEEKPLPLGHERILFIDDEQSLANLATKMLSSRGYRVDARTSSIEALELFRKDPGRFDLVITDMTMPGMTGDRLAQELLIIRPGIPVILCTGYNEHITEERTREIGIRRFILKPLDMRSLTETIRKVLDEG